MRTVRIGDVQNSLVIDRKVVLTGSANWTASTARNSEELNPYNLVASEAVASAYTSHWQDRLVASVPYTRREDWCHRPEVAGVKSEAPPR
jgi:phosphatidylserine/phosphatidylglycerophosphate/cardiolipin synthase-like enzyme